MKRLNILLAIVFLLGTSNVEAQIRLKDKLKKVEGSVDQRTDQGIEKGLDKTQESLGKLLKKKDNQEQKQQQVPEEQQSLDQNQSENQNVTVAQPAQQTLETYSRFDFIPGEKVIFYEDFSQDAVGDFPALWNTNGSGEVVNSNLFPGNWLQFTPKSYAAIWTDQLLQLPENYTLEFDIIPTKGNEGDGMAGYIVRLYKCENEKTYDGGGIPGAAGFEFTTEYYGTPRYQAYINYPENEQINISGSNDEEKNKQVLNQKYHISIWVQKTRIRLYLNENKVFDSPRAISLTSRFDRFRIDDGAGLISNIRIAVGAPDTRNKLITEGKLVTYGIYFDVNKDVVKPESYGTLKDIAKILNEVPDVKVKIIGHTDADGQDAANLDLSKRRAASVKAELVKSFGVNSDRLETDGMGEAQPVAPNDTPSNKSLNRRVEFIKL